MLFGELCRGWLQVPSKWRTLEISGLECDSRRVKRGDVFVAVPGETTDGHRYIQQAVEAGAVAVLGEERLPRRVAPYFRVADARQALGNAASCFYRHPSRVIDVVGVTGTKGKTTTTWLLDTILRQAGAVTGLFGTIENRIASRTFKATNTTAGCLDIHRWLRELADADGSHATLEVSSHALQQRRIAAVNLRCAIFTNISPEHLDYHKTFERYLESKTALFAMLPSSSVAVLPREVRYAQYIAERTKAAICWYGGDLQDSVRRVRTGPRGIEFVWKGMPVHSRLWGHHNLLNAVAAMTAAECLGVSPREIVRGVEEAIRPPGRLEEVNSPAPFRVVVDYAHTDGSLDAVLRALRPLTRGRLITIFGCGGDRDRTKRPRMGRVAEAHSDQIIVTSDNPRSEPPDRIMCEIAAGLEREGDAVFVEDRREAIGLGIRMARRGDTVLIAGKGHESYQELRDRVIDFDDRKVAVEFLEELVMSAQGLGV